MEVFGLVQLTFDMIEKKNDPSTVIYEESQRLHSLKRFKEALVFINVAIEHDNNEYKYHHLKAVILKDLKRFRESREAFDQCIKLKDSEDVHIDKAKMLYEWANSLNDKNKALELINESIEILSYTSEEIDMEKYWYMKGSILDCLGQKMESRKCYLIAEGFHDELAELDRQSEMLKSSDDTLIAITGIHFYYGFTPFEKGVTVDLIKETDNEHDPDAIRVEIEGETVGYVANSEYTVVEGVKSATEIKKLDYKKAEIVFIYLDQYIIAKLV